VSSQVFWPKLSTMHWVFTGAVCNLQRFIHSFLVSLVERKILL
jgi:hypothetical protein